MALELALSPQTAGKVGGTGREWEKGRGGDMHLSMEEKQGIFICCGGVRKVPRSFRGLVCPN